MLNTFIVWVWYLNKIALNVAELWWLLLLLDFVAELKPVMFFQFGGKSLGPLLLGCNYFFSCWLCWSCIVLCLEEIALCNFCVSLQRLWKTDMSFLQKDNWSPYSQLQIIVESLTMQVAWWVWTKLWCVPFRYGAFVHLSVPLSFGLCMWY